MDWSLEGRETSLRPQPDDAGHPGEGCARAGAQGCPVRFHTCLRVPVGPLLEATPDQRLFSLIEGVFRADPENTALSPGDPGASGPEVPEALRVRVWRGQASRPLGVCV